MITPLAARTTIANVSDLTAGPSTITADDRRWATLLHTHFASRLASWPVHLATRRQMQPLTPDDAG